MTEKRKLTTGKKVLLGFLAFLALILVAAIIYVIYVFATYYRIEDNLELEVGGSGSGAVSVGKEQTVISYNIGFGAYTPDFGFFMDGGTESRAKSKESVLEVMDGITAFLKEKDADFMFIQEVDQDATRSYHVDESKIITDALDEYSYVYGINYDSPYLFYPFTQPHGKSLAGLMTMSKYEIESSIRRSLPIEDTLMKFLDLDRCYTVSRVPTDNGKELLLYSIHLSAYTSDGTIATQQLEMLIEDMQTEYEKGNYIVCGGDFNKDILGDSSVYFGNADKEYTWAQPVPEELFNGTDLKLIAPFDGDNPVPSCRNADGPYYDGQFVLTVDGFIVSDNVSVINSNVYDLGFEYSDHNPVYMTFVLDK